jgi:hypothetical protein
MPLTTVSTTAPAGGRASQEAVRKAVRELQGLQHTVVAGAAANADIAVPGIATQDVLVGVIQMETFVDRKAACSITSAGNIRCSASTVGNHLIVTYFHLP